MSVARRCEFPVKVAVIGCGAAFENLYARPLTRLGRAGAIEFVGVADPNEQRRELARAQVGARSAFAEAGEMVRVLRPELTLVISPPALHLAHCSDAVGVGSHVLCEKPLADTVEAGDRIMRLAKDAGVLAAVEMPRRFYPNSAAAREWVHEGKLGTVRSYRYREGSIYSWPVVGLGAFDRKTAGGGVLQDKGPHVLDLLEWTFGTAEIVTSADDALGDGVEANVALELDHQGIRGQVQISWDQDLNNGFHIIGDQRELLVPLGPVDHFFARTPGRRWDRIEARVGWPHRVDRERAEVRSPRDAYAGIELQLVQMLRSVVHGEPVPVSAEDGLRTLRLLGEAYRRATPLEQGWLPESEAAFQRTRHWNRPAGRS